MLHQVSTPTHDFVGYYVYVQLVNMRSVRLIVGLLHICLLPAHDHYNTDDFKQSENAPS